jgi:N-acetylglucosamine-6-phosphate deacetylase
MLPLMKVETLFINGRIVSPGLDIPDGAVWVRDGRVQEVFENPSQAPRISTRVDLEGGWLLPGFIDIHCHGAGGSDVCDATQIALQRIAQCKVAEGVTTWLPTTLTQPAEHLQEVMSSIGIFQRSNPLLRVPGAHVEGPFLNPKKVGAQNPAYVRLPDLSELQRLADRGPIAVLSLAPELPGALEMVQWAADQGITVSAAHSSATYAEFLAAKAVGLRHLTHFCNQMSPLHHRDIGLVGAGLVDPDVGLELICDGIHLSPEMIQLIFAKKPLHQLMLITDAISASHMPDGVFLIGGLPVSVKEGAARLSDGTLAGSALRMNHALKNVAQITRMPLADLVGTTAANQAASLGLTDVGKITPGAHADFVLLRPDYTVAGTWVGGSKVFSGPAAAALQQAV